MHNFEMNSNQIRRGMEILVLLQCIVCSAYPLELQKRKDFLISMWIRLSTLCIVIGVIDFFSLFRFFSFCFWLFFICRTFSLWFFQLSLFSPIDFFFLEIEASNFPLFSTFEREKKIQYLPVITFLARDSVHKTWPRSGWHTDMYRSNVKLTVK